MIGIFDLLFAFIFYGLITTGYGRWHRQSSPGVIAEANNRIHPLSQRLNLGLFRIALNATASADRRPRLLEPEVESTHQQTRAR